MKEWEGVVLNLFNFVVDRQKDLPYVSGELPGLGECGLVNCDHVHRRR